MGIEKEHFMTQKKHVKFKLQCFGTKPSSLNFCLWLLLNCQGSANSGNRSQYDSPRESAISIRPFKKNVTDPWIIPHMTL